MPEDEIQVTLLSHFFFKLVQNKWIHSHRKYKTLEIPENYDFNLANGGFCDIFTLLFKLKKAFVQSGQYWDAVDEFLRTLKPDFMKDRGEYNPQNMLEFTCLKVVNKIKQKGKDLKSVFDLWDYDKNGWRKYTHRLISLVVDPKEIMNGIRNDLQLSLSNEELHILTQHFDKDGDNRVTFVEFQQKISIKDVAQQSQRYVISEAYFTE